MVSDVWIVYHNYEKYEVLEKSIMTEQYVSLGHSVAILRSDGIELVFPRAPDCALTMFYK